MLSFLNCVILILCWNIKAFYNFFRIKNDLGDDAFKMSVLTPTGGRVRSWTQVLNFHNGTYLGRFRMYDYAGDISISIKHQGRELEKSPFIVKGKQLSSYIQMSICGITFVFLTFLH